MTYNDSSKSVSRIKIFGYALGDGAVSITMTGVSNFAMLYYTQILGLGAVYAGIALSITMFWDAITDPAMGHITDNTRTRFGRRVPYMVLGGIAMALSFFLLGSSWNGNPWRWAFRYKRPRDRRGIGYAGRYSRWCGS